MRIAVYDAMGFPAGPVPVAGLRRTDVEIDSDDWSVGDVLTAAGQPPVNHFALVQSEDGGVADLGHSVKFTHLAYGADESGRVYMAGPPVLPWCDFVRASELGLSGAGSPEGIAVFSEGTAGDLTPDGLWELVKFLFESRELIATELATLAGIVGPIEGGRRLVSSKRKQIIARSWRKKGFNCPGVREYLRRIPQWDPERLMKQMGLERLEAVLALTTSGYVENEDGLWRPGQNEVAEGRRRELDAIEDQAEKRIDEGWSDEFPVEDDE